MELPERLKPLYPFRSCFLDTPAGKQHFIDEGEGPAILMVHGNPTWSFYYRNVVQALRKTHRCIVPDHLGCGFSDKPQDWTYRLNDHIENLQCLIDSLELERFSLISHDWGGAIGMGLAVRNVDRIERITILNTAAFPFPQIPLRISVCRWPAIGKILVRGFNGFCKAATRMTTQQPLPEAVKEAYLFPYGNWHDRVAILRFVRDIPMREGHPSWETLKEIEAGLEKLTHAPMLIGWGMHDWVFTPAILQVWRQRFPNAVIEEFAEAGHYVLEDAVDTLIPRIQSFLMAEEVGKRL